MIQWLCTGTAWAQYECGWKSVLTSTVNATTSCNVRRWRLPCFLWLWEFLMWLLRAPGNTWFTKVTGVMFTGLRTGPFCRDSGRDRQRVCVGSSLDWNWRRTWRCWFSGRCWFRWRVVIMRPWLWSRSHRLWCSRLTHIWRMVCILRLVYVTTLPANTSTKWWPCNSIQLHLHYSKLISNFSPL